jgi:hypothetical protein
MSRPTPKKIGGATVILQVRFASAFLVLLGIESVTEAEGQVPVWGRWEAAFTAAETNPDASLSVVVTSPNGDRTTVEGFWDGGTNFKVRFMPSEAGTWKYRATSHPKIDGLDGQSGLFEVVPAAPAEPAAPADSDNPLLRHGPLRVADEGRYLVHADGTPFFWLGDTTWNGPAKSTGENWQTYLEDRRDKDFNVIQYNAIAPWRAATEDAEGHAAFTGRENIQINPEYFQRLDKRIDAVNDAGLAAAHVLIWSLTDKDPGKYLPEEDIIKLIRYQLARYGSHHMVWILAGDNPYSNERGEKWKRIGQAVFGDRPEALVTTHPTGMNFPWPQWENQDWLDILGYQSGHGDNADKWRWIHSGPAAAYWKKTQKPIINLEPCYEDHRAYHSREPHPAYNVRRDVYFSLLSHPPSGVTYGGHGIWSWQTVRGEEPADHGGTGVAKIWHEAMNLPGSRHMQHVVEVFTSLPWWKLRPDDELVTGQPFGDDPARRVLAATTADGAAALVYLPSGGTVALQPDAIRNKSANWFDPRTGEPRDATAQDGGRFTAPSEDDWVLVLRGL